MSRLVDLTGKRYGKLTVLKRSENHVSANGIQHRRWLCKCDCGKEVIVDGEYLKNGDTKSCGCLRAYSGVGNPNYRHGALVGQQTRLYRIWSNMKQRCNNPLNPYYQKYGGRGIDVCDEWQSDFPTFAKWAKDNGYTDDLTIDRIDVNKGYSPENCRFASMDIQANNTTRNHHIAFNGQTKTMSEWANEFGIKYSTLRSRINLLGWDIERALTTPQRTYS